MTTSPQLALFEPPPEAPLPTDYALATCNFHAYRPEMGKAVSTSVGRPRFFSFPYVNLDAAAPHNLRHIEDLGVFAPRYLARLEEHKEEIIQALTDLATDGEPIVLLCFENLAKGKWCHRTTLGLWLFETTGQVVPELGPH